MNITIIGNGAIGNLIAFRCQQTDKAFQVLSRQDQATELAVIDTDNQSYELTLPAATFESLSNSEVIIIPLKAYQIQDFIEQIRAFIQPWQTLVLLHNGMGTIESVKALLPRVNLIAGTTSSAAYKPDKNNLHIKGAGDSHLGWIVQQENGEHRLIEQHLAEILTPLTWHQDIHLALWFKLAINAAINPLTALHNIKNGALQAGIFQVQIIPLCEEITQIMRCLGFELENTTLLDRVNKVIKNTAENFSSMNRDVQEKRPTEIDFINGYIAKQAIKYHLSCPINSELFNEIKRLEHVYLRS